MSPDSLSPIPIPDDQLHGTVVMECSVSRIEELTDRFEGQIQAQDRLIDALFVALKAYGSWPHMAT